LGDGDSELSETLRFFSSSFLSFSDGRAGDSDCFFAALRSLLTKIQIQYNEHFNFNLGTRSKWVFKAKPWPLSSWGQPLLPIVEEAQCAPGLAQKGMKKRKYLAPPLFAPQIIQPAVSHYTDYVIQPLLQRVAV